MWVVVDHLSGNRRGQRQELELAGANGRLQIGRHPDCDIGLDTRRDLEASTRHAEIRMRGNDLVLFDVGSSNGTYVSGDRVHEVVLVPGAATEVQFGARGPRLRIWWDRDADPADAPPLPAGRSRMTLVWVGLAIIALAAVGIAIALSK